MAKEFQKIVHKWIRDQIRSLLQSFRSLSFGFDSEKYKAELNLAERERERRRRCRDKNRELFR